MKNLLCALAMLVMAGYFMPARAVQLTTVRDDLAFPIFATHSGDGTNRLFFVEKGGRIRVQVPANNTLQTFLDISSKISANGERGLLGLAFHPNYKSNRRFFVHYTRVSDGAITIAEYVASPTNPNLALSGEKILLTIPHPLQNHNGGMIAFGPDGFLYIATGDGGGANDPNNNAQNKNVLLGKILRIDVDNTSPGLNYAIPSDNPLAGTTAGREEIYALGLRNPWRFSFDRVSGRLWCGDVGQDALEEVNIISRGSNYGWRTFEGTQCTGLNDGCDTFRPVPPLYEYGRDKGCAITGGYAYRGRKNTLPIGAYIFGDFCSGTVSMFYRGTASLLISSGESITSFGEDEAGEIYVVCSSGTVFRIEGAIASVSSVALNEGNSGRTDAVFQVQLSSAAPQAVNLSFATRNGTAVAGQDYEASNGVLIFAPGETQKTVRVPVIGDTNSENDETFTLRLTRVFGVRVSAASTGTAVIRNDDGALRPPSILSLTPDDASSDVDEIQEFTVVYSDSDGAASIAHCFLQAGPTLAAADALLVLYNPRTNLLYLRDDANSTWLGGYAPGSNRTISNTQGTLHCASTRVSSSGQNLTVNWSLSATSALRGTTQNLYLRVHDETGLQTASPVLGTWTINDTSN